MRNEVLRLGDEEERIHPAFHRTVGDVITLLPQVGELPIDDLGLFAGGAAKMGFISGHVSTRSSPDTLETPTRG